MPWDTPDATRIDPTTQTGMALIGAAVRRRRERLGWSQRDLARRANLDQSTISRLENGRRVGLRLATIARVVAILGGLDFEPFRGSPAPPRPRGRSIRSMYTQIQELHEAILAARIEQRVQDIEEAEREGERDDEGDEGPLEPW